MPHTEHDNYIQIEERQDNNEHSVSFFQVEAPDCEPRKVIDLLFDAPSGEDYRVTVKTGSKVITLEVGDVCVSDIAKVYNGVRLRKAK